MRNIDLTSNTEFADVDFVKLGYQHKGFMHERCNIQFEDEINGEKMFYESWKEECKPVTGVNYGNGTLQDLFFKSPQHVFDPGRKILHVTAREKFIVATVIQWLGSNCGFCFLRQTLNKMGYTITKNN